MKQQEPNAAEHGNKIAGSSAPDEPVFLVIGKFRRPHGLMGEMFFEVMTDFPDRLKHGKEIFVGETHELMKIQSSRAHRDGLLLSLEGINDRDLAAIYTNQLVFVKIDQVPALEEGRYYHHELIGMLVDNESGNRLGIIQEILETGANDVLVIITKEGKEILLPAVDEVIIRVDMESRSMIVRPLEWV